MDSLRINGTDLTGTQVSSPANALLRFNPTAARGLLLPQEYYAWQVAVALTNAQADVYAQANNAFTDDLSLLALPDWFPAEPLLIDGYTFALFLDDDANISRLRFELNPTCAQYRAFACRLFLDKNDPPIDGPGLHAATEKGVVIETSTWTDDSLPFPPNTLLAAGFQFPAGPALGVSGLFQIAPPTLTDCAPTLSPLLQFHPCDRLIFPVFIWAAYDSDIYSNAITFSLTHIESSVNTPLTPILLHAVFDAQRQSIPLYFDDSVPPNSAYRVYALDIPKDAADGCYRIDATVTDSIGTFGAITYPSDAFRIGHECKSTLLRYRSLESQFDFYYRDPSDNSHLAQAWHQVRIPAQLIDYTPTADRSDYLRSDGVRVKLRERVGKQYTLEVDYLPEALHERLALALAHDVVELYDTTRKQWLPYVLTGDYTIDWPDDQSPLAPARAELSLANYSANNPYV